MMPWGIYNVNTPFLGIFILWRYSDFRNLSNTDIFRKLSNEATARAIKRTHCLGYFELHEFKSEHQINLSGSRRCTINLYVRLKLLPFAGDHHNTCILLIVERVTGNAVLLPTQCSQHSYLYISINIYVLKPRFCRLLRPWLLLVEIYFSNVSKNDTMTF